MKGLAPSAATRADLSGSSRGSPADALGDLRVTVRASPPGTPPRTSYSSRSEHPVRFPGDFAGLSHGAPSISFGAPSVDRMSIAASGDGFTSSEDEGAVGLSPSGVVATAAPDPELTAMLAWAAVSIGLEVNRPPSPEPSRLDDWFLPRCLSSRRCMRSWRVRGWPLSRPEAARPPPPSSLPSMAEWPGGTRAFPRWRERSRCTCAHETPPLGGTVHVSRPRPVSWQPLSRPKLTVLRARQPPPCTPWLSCRFTKPRRSNRCTRVVPTRGWCRSCARRLTSLYERRKSRRGPSGRRCPPWWSRSAISGSTWQRWRTSTRHASSTPPSPREGCSATPSRASPSSSRRYSSRLRRSSTSCPGVMHHPPLPSGPGLSLPVAVGALLHPPEPLRPRPNRHIGRCVEPLAGERRPPRPSQAPSRPGICESWTGLCTSSRSRCWRTGAWSNAFSPRIGLQRSTWRTLSTVCVRRSGMAVQGPPLWALPVSPCVHEGCRGRPYPVTGSGRQDPQLPRRLAYSSPIQRAVGRSQGLGALAPQPVGASGQLGKEQALPCAENLFSRCGVRLGEYDGMPHGGTCPSSAELPEFLQRQECGTTETVSEAPGAYGIRSCSHAARIASYETTSALATLPGPEVGMAPRYTASRYLPAVSPLPQPLDRPCLSRHTVVTADASSTGWGATCNGQAASGLWTGPRLLWHINCLELWAVHLALRQFRPLLLGKHVLVHTDNTAAVSYINRLGGIRSHRMSQLARHLLLWSHTQFKSLRAVHIPGQLNRAADALSRQLTFPGEWRLHPETIRLIWSRFGEAQVDLFASPESSHCQLYFSLTEGPLGTDALAHSWPRALRKYAFPPVSLLAQTLCKLREDEEQVLLVAPHWPTRT